MTRPMLSKFVHNGLCLMLSAFLAVALVACEDSEQEQKVRAAKFTTSTKPAPNPQYEALETLVRADKLSDAASSSVSLFAPFSYYNGEDMHQLTGVSGRSLLLCLTAPWCDYSKKMEQSLQTLSKEEKGAVQVIIIDADQYPSIAAQYDLNKVPTTILYVEGVKLRRIEGAYTAASLQKYLRKTLSIHSNETP